MSSKIQFTNFIQIFLINIWLQNWNDDCFAPVFEIDYELFSGCDFFMCFSNAPASRNSRLQSQIMRFLEKKSGFLFEKYG